jgi:hypothetical protein
MGCSTFASGASGTQFTCFSSTKVQILTAEELLAQAQRTRRLQGPFTCFTGTKVQILTAEELLAQAQRTRATSRTASHTESVPHFTCFTSNSVRAVPLAQRTGKPRGIGTHFTCFTSTKVLILPPEALLGQVSTRSAAAKSTPDTLNPNLSLLALLVYQSLDTLNPKLS